jgi:serine/threonine-protein kinase
VEVVRAGTVLANKYRVERILGMGGMGIVVAALNEQAMHRVAVKLLLPELARKPVVVERFLREARAIRKLRGEHVPRVLDVGATRLPGLEAAGDVPFFAMELLEGVSVAQVLASGPLTPETACRYVIEACAALGEAHELGIVHRDLKPSNMFVALGDDGSVTLKVLDFGVSKLMDTDDTSLTQSSTVLGSPSYMSPEQLLSPRDVDHLSDVWSLGVILYEMLAKRRPFVGETMPALSLAISSQEPAPLREAQPDIPRELEEIVLRCLSKDAAARYPSVAALAAALAPFAGSVTSLEVPKGVAQARVRREAAVADAGDTTVPLEASPPVHPSSSTRRPYLVVVAMVLLVAAVAAWPLWHRYRASARSGAAATTKEPASSVSSPARVEPVVPTAGVSASASVPVSVSVSSASSAGSAGLAAASASPANVPGTKMRHRSPNTPAPSASTLFDGRKW